MSPPRRLQMVDGEQIGEQIKALGFEIEVRPRPSPRRTPPREISIWTNEPMCSERKYLGTIRWVKRAGWVMELVIPTLRTDVDLGLGLNLLQESHSWQGEADGIWRKYQDSRSTKNWETYMGVLAAFYTGGSFQGSSQVKSE